MSREEFKYKICGLDRVVEEKGSAFLALRKIAWGVGEDEEVEDEKDIKLDLRKYYSSGSGEKMNKGVSFMTEEGPSELVHILLEEGYGDTARCLEIIKDRANFKEAVTFVYDGPEGTDSEDVLDPRELFLN